MKSVIFGVTLVICLFVVELIIRASMPHFDPRRQFPLRRDEKEGITLGFPGQTFRQWTPKGDYDVSLTFNSLGLRDRKELSNSTSNDVFVLGDSHTMGWGIKEGERYSDLLEKRLGVPCYNVAIPGDIRAYINLIKYAERHSAKVRNLIVGVCMENDIWDYSDSSDTFQRAYRRTTSPARALLNWVKTHSAVWICASHQIQRFPTGRALFEKLGIAKNIEALTHPNEYSRKNMLSTRDELLKLTTNYNAIVLLIPSRGLWDGRNAPIEGKIHSEFVGLLREVNMPFVDLRPVFEQTGNPLQFYFATDQHSNAAGQAKAAEELERFIRVSLGWASLFSTRDSTAQP
jgi:hypothetical protein